MIAALQSGLSQVLSQKSCHLKSSMARYLVTGANGFVGQHLTSLLREKNHEVTSLSHDLFYGYEDPLEFHIKNINPDIIVHLAAYGNLAEHEKYLDEIYHGNITATYNLLKATKDIPYKAFINMSSSSVMLSYETMYSACKKATEALCRTFANQFDKRIINVRPFSIYGEGEQQSHLIPRLFRSCLYKEPMKFASYPVHDFVYVADIVTQLIKLAQDSVEWPATEVQVGTGIATSNDTVKRLIEEITGRKAHITDEVAPRPYDTKNWKASADKGWVYFQPTSLVEGLQKTYSSYKL